MAKTAWTMRRGRVYANAILIVVMALIADVVSVVVSVVIMDIGVKI